MVAGSVRRVTEATMQHPEVQAFFHEPSHTFSYVAWDPATRKAAVIDAALDYDAAPGAPRTRPRRKSSPSCANMTSRSIG